MIQNIEKLKRKIENARDKIATLDDNVKINKLAEDIIVSITGAYGASIWVYETNQLLRYRDKTPDIVDLELKKGLLYRCYITNESRIYNHLSTTNGYLEEIDNPDNIDIKSKIMIPLMHKDRFLGIVTAYSTIKKNQKFTIDHLDIFQAICPFFIEVIYKLNKTYINERRKVDSKDNGFRRRDSDLINNLKTIQYSQEHTKEPQEILQYVTNLVHDIRTPANGLSGFLEILQEHIEDERLSKYIADAKKSAEFINDLTTSILNGVKSNRELEVSQSTQIKSFEFFSEIAELFSAKVYKKSISYNIYIDPKLPKEIEIDSMKLRRVLMNLLGNAVKFTPQGGEISFLLKYNKKQKKVYVVVSDSGIGIAKNKHKDIFKRFVQAQKDTVKKHGGSGLGLFISASYIKDMGGELSVKSKLNRGSKFYFEIPVKVVNEAVSIKQIANEGCSIAILADESNIKNQKLIVKYLKKLLSCKYSVKVVKNSSDICEETTHVIAFENRLSAALFELKQKRKFKLLIVETNYLSLQSYNLDGSMLISAYNCYANGLHSFLNQQQLPKVLIVEDDKIAIRLLSAMLEGEECELDIARDGAEGLKLLKTALINKQPYMLVYTDLKMPLLSGLNMLKEYHKLMDEHGSHLFRAVAISGEDIDPMDRMFFDYFATKPFKKQEIVSIFTKTLNSCIS